jgi:hypothetical protein
MDAVGLEQVSGASPLEQLYAEVSTAYHSITDFRGKLLALVPALSGTAFTLIIGAGEEFDQRLLLPVGLFGFAVTMGLFCYELRGMLLCHELRERGAALERAMQGAHPPPPVMRGHFLDRTQDHTIKDALERCHSARQPRRGAFA